MAVREVIYLTVLEVFDIAARQDVKLFFSNVGLASTPSDFPENTFFDPRIIRPIRIQRNMFAPGRTFGPSQVGLGDLVLTNADGGLDFLDDYAFDGRRITQYRGRRGAGGKFKQVLVASIAGKPILTRDKFVLKVRDRQTDVDVEVQATKYGGGNALPLGLDGVASDLRGKPKPFLVGKVINIAPPVVNTSKLIYQVHDGVIASLDAVYDRGVNLSRSLQSWTQETTPVATDLFDAAFATGTWMAMGAAGVLLTSTDGGANWISRTSQFGADTVRRGIFSPSLNVFLIVGDNNKISASGPTGVTWVARTSVFAALTRINDVAFGNGFFCVVGDSNQIQTSPDGATFTSRVSAFAPGDNITSIVFSEEQTLFVAGGQNGKIQTSPDGITWTLVESGLDSTVTVLGMAFGNGLFIGAGESTGGTDIVISTSPDGIAWTSRRRDGYSFTDLTFSEFIGRFVGTATHAGYSHALLSTRDGQRWDYHSAGFDTSAVQGVGSNSEGEILSVSLGGKVGSADPPPAPYGSEADLLADALAPPAGSFNVFLAGGYFRLGSTPVGLVTADVTEGATPADQTAAQIYIRIGEKVGLDEQVDYNAQDILKLDADRPDIVGIWTGIGPIFASELFNAIAESIGGWWGVGAEGQFRIQEVFDPRLQPALLEFTDDDMTVDLNQVLVEDPGRGIPNFKTIVRYARNYAPSGDLAFGVSESRRAELAQQWRTVEATDTTLLNVHLLAREQIYETLLLDEAEAQAQADAFQNLRGVKRRPYSFAVDYTQENELLDLGVFIKITHPRFGLSEGKNFIVISEDKDPRSNEINLIAWG